MTNSDLNRDCIKNHSITIVTTPVITSLREAELKGSRELHELQAVRPGALVIQVGIGEVDDGPLARRLIDDDVAGRDVVVLDAVLMQPAELVADVNPVINRSISRLILRTNLTYLSFDGIASKLLAAVPQHRLTNVIDSPASLPP